MLSDNLWAFTRAFIVTVIFMPALIKFLKQSKEQAVIRKLGPDHQSKAGTPSIGGALFIASAALSAIISGFAMADGQQSIFHMLILVLAMLAFGIIGGIDDVLKLINHTD
ncbi:MAG: phospho-N-acetylmuramoyl-pentapeptide-transferase, partial [Leuconostoc fallax]